MTKATKTTQDEATPHPTGHVEAKVHSIPTELIDPSPAQTRVFGKRPDDALKGLAASIAKQGVLEPVLVRASPKQTGRFELIAGERRTRASKIAGKDAVPAIVLSMSDLEAEQITVVENLQRQDLKPMEEARGVQLLLEREGWGYEEVAAQIGQSPAWVARRSGLTKLSKKWQKLIAKPGSTYSQLGTGHLEVIARLPVESQDRVLEWGWLFSGPDITIAAIQREVDGKILQKLKSAPWGLGDAKLLPAAGACSACPKRSSCQPLLWDGPEGQAEMAAKEDTCTDSTCWDLKLGAHVLAKTKALEERHGASNVVRLSQAYWKGDRPEGSHYSHEYREVKSREEGAKPAVHVDGHRAGQTTYVVPASRGNTGAGAKKAAGPTPLAARKVRLRRLRLKLAIASLAAQLKAISPDQIDSLPQIEDLQVLALVAGTNRRYEAPTSYTPGGSWGWVHWHHISKPAGKDGITKAAAEAAIKAGTPEQASGLWALFDLYRVKPKGLRQGLWLAILPVLLSRLQYHAQTPIEAQWVEAKRISQLCGLDHEAAWKAAEAAKPEPKSWAKLNADGTPKRAGKAKKRAKGGKARKR